ncbi:hypothetical protein F2P56_033371 [Juglans regia]|uniref:DUF4283 domain-containing protein n=1 Tax=Juglans regia TaxID=51240 RepID=A0A833TW53_JUGRE|nr:hypothetical protein F2P56_033371 [Juglans regia]
MQTPQHVFLIFAKKEDLCKAFAREACDIGGTSYRLFKWSTDFSEEKEPSLVPVWIFFPGLPPNFYHKDFLCNLVLPMGNYIRSDNSTMCASRINGVRVCIEMDASLKPIEGFWIGIRRAPPSRFQSVIYETLPAYCPGCNMQEHNASTCKKAEADNRKGEEGKKRAVFGGRRREKKGPKTGEKMAGNLIRNLENNVVFIEETINLNDIALVGESSVQIDMEGT